MMALERARDQEQVLENEAQQRGFAEREAAIDDREKAARKQLASGILNGVAKVCKGAASLAGGGGGRGGEAGTSSCGKGVRVAKRSLLAAEGGLGIIGQGLTRGAATSNADGERHDLRADELKAAAKRAESARSGAEQAANRLMNGISEIQRLRHEASTAALRG
jgi:hypothetical protein